jgi:hypothetical protein
MHSHLVYPRKFDPMSTCEQDFSYLILEVLQDVVVYHIFTSN